MKSVFVDSQYWIAMAHPKDSWRPAAKAATKALGDILMVTTDEVLTEFLTSLSGGGPDLRRVAGKMVRAILANPNVTVVPQTRSSFLDGLTRYAAREDKSYSLTDCISMNTMDSRSLSEVLTNDHHFQQEGLTPLMARED